MSEPYTLNPLLQILLDSLVQKKELLLAIEEKSREQETIVKKGDFTFKEIDENMNEKGELIEKISLLDNGFETLYDRIRLELMANKDNYKEQIRQIQSLISDVVALGATIEAIEARNKAAIEAYFNREKKELQNKKSASLAAYSYYMTSRNINSVLPQFVDRKN